MFNWCPLYGDYGQIPAGIFPPGHPWRIYCNSQSLEVNRFALADLHSFRMNEHAYVEHSNSKQVSGDIDGCTHMCTRTHTHKWTIYRVRKISCKEDYVIAFVELRLIRDWAMQCRRRCFLQDSTVSTWITAKGRTILWPWSS